MNPAVVTTVTNTPSLPAAQTDDEQDDDSVAYGTLAAAVAAQAIPDTIDEELQCMAGAIYFEAKGEPLSGQLAVAEVSL
ncbi:hypothetical protein PCJ53_29570, partial [Klebsiella pneumoniae]|nr:hypothetical protein [Klebsiella pneumoniae]